MACRIAFSNMAAYRYNLRQLFMKPLKIFETSRVWIMMSPIAQRFLIASLVYLMLGLLAQTVTVFDLWLGFNPLAYTAVSATMQLLLLGWLTQLGLALVYDRWLRPVREQIISGGSPWRPGLPMTVFVLFNIGLPLVIIGQPGLIMLGGNWLGAAAAFGALLQLFAGLAFVYDAWQTMLR